MFNDRRTRPLGRPFLPALVLLAATPAQAALVITIHPPAGPITGTEPVPLKAVAQDPANPAANPLLTWTVETADGGACRFEPETGVWHYHPPADRTAILNVQVRATSVAEPARSATATLVLLPDDPLWRVINGTLNEGADFPWVAAPEGKGQPSVPWAPKHKLEPATGTASQGAAKRLRTEAGAAPVTGKAAFPPATWMLANGNAPAPVLPYRSIYDTLPPGENLLGRRTFSTLRIGGFPPFAPYDAMAEGLNVVGYGVPLELTWDPDPRLALGAQAQGQRFSVGHREQGWRTFDVTGRSAVQLTLDRTAVCMVDMLAPRLSGGLMDLHVTMDCLVRGVLPFAGSASMPGREDGALEQARFEEPLHLAGLGKDRLVLLAVTDAKNHAIRILTPGELPFFASGQVAAFAGSAEEPGFQNGPAAVARFRNPTYMAECNHTGILVADTGNHVIRLVDARTPEVKVGLVTGVPCQAGYLDGPVREARFDRPQGLAFHKERGLFVADQGNRVIRRLDPKGIVSTLAGKAGAEGTEDGVGGQARFTDLKGLALSGDGLYVLDGHAVRKVDLASGAVTTLCGRVDEPGFRPNGRRAEGEARMAPVPCLRHPRGIVATPETLLVTDEGNHALQEISLLTGEWTTLVGGPGPTAEPPAFRPGLYRDGGPEAADQGTLPAPRGLALFGSGYAVATGSCLVRADLPYHPVIAQPRVRFDPVPGRKVKRGEPVSLVFHVDDGRTELIWLPGETLEQAQARRRAKPLRLAYELEVRNGDDSEAMILKGHCERGKATYHQVCFTAPGQGRVVFRGRSEQGVGAFAQGGELVFEVE